MRAWGALAISRAAPPTLNAPLRLHLEPQFQNRVTGRVAENRNNGFEVAIAYCTYQGSVASAGVHLENRGSGTEWAVRSCEFPFHDRRSTLWGWPGQNPLKYSDPSGRYGLDANFDHDFVNPPRNGPMPTGEKVVGAAMAAPFVAVGGLYALAELGGWFGGTTLGCFLGLGGTGAIGQKLNNSGCSSGAQRAMDSVRVGCPGGDCDLLSKQLIDKLGQGQLVTLIPKGAGALPTLPGVASTPWAQHTAVLLPNGGVMDTLLNASYPSLAAWQAAITGSAPIRVMVDGAIQ
jgi:hypothetical protein